MLTNHHFLTKKTIHQASKKMIWIPIGRLVSEDLSLLLKNFHSNYNIFINS